jgi:hypothetical protein
MSILDLQSRLQIEGGTSCSIKRTRAKSLALAGLFQCAREDSNLHDLIGSQGPQPR